MATAPETSAKPAKTTPPVPPEEKFWQRYSPHQEMPLSAVSSFLLHTLVIGMLLLLAWLGWLGFRKTGGPLPVEAVRFAGGGGGTKTGSANDGTIGGPDVLQPEAKSNPDQTEQPLPPDPDRPKLDPNALVMAPEVVQNDDTVRRLAMSGNPNINIFARVDKDALSKMREGLASPRGQGGTGKGGGKGDGVGPGEGDTAGEGKSGKLSQREKRMLRWTMIFDTRTGRDYLDQLRGLGAILAIPGGPDGKTYKIVRDLSGKGPPQLRDEDISKIDRIFWIDDRPESVNSLMTALGYTGRPSHFVAFMPQELEANLFKMELAFKGRKEEQIHETKFRVFHVGQSYKPKVIEQTGR
jgi:hypothetical protein